MAPAEAPVSDQFIDDQVGMVACNGDPIPDKRKEGIGQPVHPAEAGHLSLGSQVQIHPDIEKFVGAEARNVVELEPVCLEVLAPDIEVSFETCDSPASGAFCQNGPRISVRDPNLIASHPSVHDHNNMRGGPL